MRNFHHVTDATFETSVVNGGEYVSDDVETADVLKVLSEAFGTNPNLLAKVWMEEVTKGVSFSSLNISASEFSVLVDLYEFVVYVKKSIDGRGWESKTRVFFYANLNTGKSVTWVHSVC
jgi:hypothetical protein